MTFVPGQKIKHIQHGYTGRFLGIDGNSFIVSNDSNSISAPRSAKYYPIRYISEWTSEVT
jgi:hypothetical protein